MLSVDQAIEAILARTSPLPARSFRLIDALNLILAEEILADIDLPPFDKALMDGYAVRSVDLPGSSAYRLEVIEEITAGQMPTRSLEAGQASRIMTGAPLPSGADAVVMVEKSRLEGSTVLLPGPVAPGQSRLTRGREMRAGEVLLEPGHRMSPTALGLIASAGRSEVLAIPRPSVGVLPTGDELVSLAEKPGPGQIRNSNGVMLEAFARDWGCSGVVENPVALDDPARLRQSLATALDRPDVLLISGGVSAGTRDLVPSTLAELGVETVFHKVNVKPGKPLWFGVGPARGDRPGVLVFGLPGNPSSGVVSFLLFVKPALEALAGHLPRRTQPTSYPLGKSFVHRGDRPTYHPSLLEDGKLLPIDWAGSADLRAVALAGGFASFPSGDRSYEVGDFLPFFSK